MKKTPKTLETFANKQYEELDFIFENYVLKGGDKEDAILLQRILNEYKVTITMMSSPKYKAVEKIVSEYDKDYLRDLLDYALDETEEFNSLSPEVFADKFIREIRTFKDSLFVPK